MEYKDLEGSAKSEYESAIEDSLKPLEKIGVVKKVKFGERLLWGTSANMRKLMMAVEKGLKNRGKDSNYVLINGSKILLSILPFILFQKSFDEEGNKRLDEYLEELS